MFGASGFSDFFASMFGDDVLGPRRARKRRFGSRGADVNAELRLSIGQAIAGGKRSFKLDAIAACAHCGGEGQLEDDHVCPVCAGLGRVRTEKTVELSIPKHVQDSMQLRLKGLGEAGENGGPSGDLYLTLVLDTDGTYRRAGLDIEADLPLAPWEALDGARVRLQTLDGTATLNVPPGTVWGAKLRMKGLGLTDAGGRRGDFYAIVRLALPESMSERQRELVRQMRDAGAGEIHGGARL
jgi:DnaJ-class molecular chaperone